MALGDKLGEDSVEKAQAGIVVDIALIRDLAHELLDRFDGATLKIFDQVVLTINLRPRTPRA